MAQHAIIKSGWFSLAPERGWDARFWTMVGDRAGQGASTEDVAATIEILYDEAAERHARAHDLRRQASRLVEEARRVEGDIPVIFSNRYRRLSFQRPSKSKPS